jgi:hypothetical protein
VNDVFCGSASFLADVFEIGPAKLLEVRKGRVIRPLRSRFDADLVVHSKSELLFAAQVVFRRLGQHVAEEELDLVELAADQMTETRASSHNNNSNLAITGIGCSCASARAASKECRNRPFFCRALFSRRCTRQFSPSKTYSVRNAITGSIRIALRAGIAIAAKAVNMRMTDTPMNVSGSVGWMPKSI